MGVEFQKPFTIEEIKEHPFAVVIAFLIGFILILSTVIAVLWYKNGSSDEKCDERVEAKNQQIIAIYQERNKVLEERDYYKNESEAIQQNQDSIVKAKTEKYVEKILNRGRQ